MLIFVAPDAEQWSPLESGVRHYLAWESIIEDADELNLDTHQRREALRGKDQSNETLGMRLNEAYCWLLVPTQEGTDPIEWEATRMPGPQENPVAKAVKKVQNDEQLIPQWSPALLRMELDQWLWKEESHIGLKRVWECFATYLYLPRLCNSEVLLDTVREGSEHKNISDMRIVLTSMDDTSDCNSGVLAVQFILTIRVCWSNPMRHKSSLRSIQHHRK